MGFRMIADSSANVLSWEGVDYTTVPMKIVAEKEYVDDASLDVAAMVIDLQHHKGKSGSSCPNVGEWLDAFGDAEEIFCITITKHLSGSYNAACQAANTYAEEHPGRKVAVIDSLTAGPGLMMIAQKLLECEKSGDNFETAHKKALHYANYTHTLFCLESMMNLARNGRVNIAVAKLAGMLGIRVAGAAEGGELAPSVKPRGAKNTIQALINMVRERGFRDGGLIRVAHCYAEDAANALRAALISEFPKARFLLEPTAGLCSFYAEAGGLIVAFEGAFNEKNDNNRF